MTQAEILTQAIEIGNRIKSDTTQRIDDQYNKLKKLLRFSNAECDLVSINDTSMYYFENFEIVEVKKSINVVASYHVSFKYTDKNTRRRMDGAIGLHNDLKVVRNVLISDVVIKTMENI